MSARSHIRGDKAITASIDRDTGIAAQYQVMVNEKIDELAEIRQELRQTKETLSVSLDRQRRIELQHKEDSSEINRLRILLQERSDEKATIEYRWRKLSAICRAMPREVYEHWREEVEIFYPEFRREALK